MRRSPLLDEATFDDIFRELVNRYPDGLVVVCSKPADGEEVERGWHEEDVLLAYHRLVASVGLTKLSLVMLEERAKDYFSRRKREGEKDDGDEE
jgi:hypothetical protein